MRDPGYQHAEIILERAALYAKASDAAQVRVIGYAATLPPRPEATKRRVIIRVTPAK